MEVRGQTTAVVLFDIWGFYQFKLPLFNLQANSQERVRSLKDLNVI